MDGQRHLDHGAPVDMIDGVNLAPVGFDDPTTDGQREPRTVLFRGVEGLKDLRERFRPEPMPLIVDGQSDRRLAAPVDPFTSDLDLCDLVGSLDRILQNRAQDLFHLITIELDKVMLVEVMLIKAMPIASG